MAVKFGLSIGARSRRARSSRARIISTPDLPKGYQISQYEEPVVQARLARDRARRRVRQDRRRDARAPGGGRRQVAARGARERERHRFEPRRHAAARNRLRARHALGQGGGRVHEEGAHAGALPGDLRRQHAGGIVPLRCQRVGAAARPREIRHARRDQESEFLSDSSRRRSIRSRAPDRAARERRHRGPGNAPVRLRQARDPLDALEGRGQRLPLFPGSRLCCRSRSTRRSSRRCARRCRSCRTRRRRRFARAIRTVGLRCGRAVGEPRTRRLFRGGRGAALGAAHAKLAANWVMGELSSALNRDNLEITGSRVTPRGLAACSRASSTRRFRARSPRTCSRRCGPTASAADAIIEAKGLKQITDSGAIEP
jgi:hypothetical protein